MFKQQKGVTLVALVITIIVLLILAGVSIAMLTGDNGILTKATDSKRETIIADAKEKVSMAMNVILADKLDTTTTPTYTGGITQANVVSALTAEHVTAAAEGEGTAASFVVKVTINSTDVYVTATQRTNSSSEPIADAYDLTASLTAPGE